MKRLELSTHAARLLRSARIAHLATTDAKRRPHVIPICFVFDGKCFYSAIDEKPKRSAPAKLKRLRNIQENPSIALVIDRYAENWKKLAYVLVFGKARVLASGKAHGRAVQLLRRKYPQYRTMSLERLPMIVLRAERFVEWGDLDAGKY